MLNRFQSALAGEDMPGARGTLLGGFDGRALLDQASLLLVGKFLGFIELQPGRFQAGFRFLDTEPRRLIIQAQQDRASPDRLGLADLDFGHAAGQEGIERRDALLHVDVAEADQALVGGRRGGLGREPRSG